MVALLLLLYYNHGDVLQFLQEHSFVEPLPVVEQEHVGLSIPDAASAAWSAGRSRVEPEKPMSTHVSITSIPAFSAKSVIMACLPRSASTANGVAVEDLSYKTAFKLSAPFVFRIESAALYVCSKSRHGAPTQASWVTREGRGQLVPLRSKHEP